MCPGLCYSMYMLTNTNPRPSSPSTPAQEAPVRTFFPAVDMTGAFGPANDGIVVIEVQARTYAEAYRGAVEQLLFDPEGTVRHAMRARLNGDM